MVVHIVFDARGTRRIRARLAIQYDRAAVRQHQARPDKEDSGLPERDLAIVDADQTGALRDQKKPSGGRVIDAFGDLCRDLAWKIGTNTGDERTGDDRTGLDHVG